MVVRAERDADDESFDDIGDGTNDDTAADDCCHHGVGFDEDCEACTAEDLEDLEADQREWDEGDDGDDDDDD